MRWCLVLGMLLSGCGQKGQVKPSPVQQQPAPPNSQEMPRPVLSGVTPDTILDALEASGYDLQGSYDKTGTGYLVTFDATIDKNRFMIFVSGAEFPQASRVHVNAQGTDKAKVREIFKLVTVACFKASLQEPVAWVEQQVGQTASKWFSGVACLLEFNSDSSGTHWGLTIERIE